MPSSTSSTDLLQIGRVRGIHGLNGLVKVALDWEQSSALLDLETVVAELPEGGRERLVLERVQWAFKAYLVKFQGVDDRDAARALAGARLLVPKDRLALAPGEILLVDLVGFEVVLPDGVVGTVVDVKVNPSVDSVIIQLRDATQVEQALAPSFVERLDLEARKLHLFGRDGFID